MGGNANDNRGATLTIMGEIKKARNFRNYKVWQDAVDYASKVYKVTAEMPWFEKKGLCDQLQRAVVSISSNIAEGSAKPSDAEFAHFLDTALGSAFEVETQLQIAKNVGYINEELYNNLLTEINNIEKQINGLINNIRKG
jgi:four helix bundle protein